MNVCIKPSKLSGRIDAISSKSFAHRILICAAFSGTPTEIFINTLSEDIIATIDCITAMGATTSYNEEAKVLTVTPISKHVKNVTMCANESGSTARFLLPVAAAVFENVTLEGKGRLVERPFLPLVREMQKNGTKCSADLLPITTNGLLKSGEYFLEGNISSQYLSGLLMALPLVSDGGTSTITLTSPLESKKYVDITLEVMKEFGVAVSVEENKYIIEAKKYISPKKIYTEGDWSNGAFWIVASAIGSNIELSGLNPDSVQGDRKIVELLEATEIDAKDIPDLVPILSVLALKRKGRTRIYNAERLKLKESNRLETVCKALSALGGDLTENGSEIIINGTGTLKGGTTFGYIDHRIIMSCAIASTFCENDCIIEGAESVRKSYPEFFDDFKKLGGIVDVL